MKPIFHTPKSQFNGTHIIQANKTSFYMKYDSQVFPSHSNRRFYPEKLAMTLFLGKAQLCFFTFLSILFLIHAKLHLDPSDFKALSIIQKHLGVKVLYPPSTNSCNIISGIFCERRLSDNTTYVLRITGLVFNSQKLIGFLSPAIGRLSELKELSLSNNNLTDQLPLQLLDCRKLEILNLANNQFSGEFPAKLTKRFRLKVLDISSNNLNGNISFLKYFPNLENISIANNLFTGKIPESIHSLRNLNFFNFSGNQFHEVSLFPRRYIYAENSTSRSNKTSAKEPSGTKASSAQAPGAGTSSHPKHKKNNKKTLGWILGFLAGFIAGTISSAIFTMLYKMILSAVRGGRKDSGPAIFSPLIKKDDLAFLKKDDALASLQMIGSGGCGEVYKSELPGSNGKLIAIKKIVQPRKDAAELTEEDSKLLNKKMRQIKSEINTVGQIRHRNLLPLLAHVSRPDCHYLVYEFMKNGSLQDLLNDVSEGKKELDWPARHRIALGIAAGLEYLHINHNPRIIHRDLKPGNVLLDDDMEARIADFGLAKAMPDAHTHITTSNVAGTFGYIAPEYHQTLKFTDKCDIYSFGVLLGVLVMGKLPSDKFFHHQNEMGLAKWLGNIMTSENPQQAIDQRLMGHGYEEQMLLVLKIAFFCTRDNPKERPNSKEVRTMLSQIKR